MIETKKNVFRVIKALKKAHVPIAILVLMMMAPLNYHAKANTFDEHDIEQQRTANVKGKITDV